MRAGPYHPARDTFRRTACTPPPAPFPVRPRRPAARRRRRRSGFAGLYQLHRLRELGLRTRVFEACDDIGGTWYRNRYPGARCDVESTAYSFSFSPELDQEWEWSERYATQPEILRYLHHVADRFDLRKDVTLRTRVVRAVYDEDRHVWQIATDTGETVTTRFVVLATGCMSAVKEPDIPGVAAFAGRSLHTADWPHEGVDLTGRRVAVIGTGCSGVQAIPLLAEQAAGLTVFQRTPVYALPALNRPLTAEETAAFKARYPEFRAAQRKSRGGTVFELPTQSALEVDEAERTAAFEAGWDSGLLSGLLRTYTDILADRAANETVAEFVRSKIRSIVTDPETAETLSPRTFPFGTKRPCLDTDYYATYNRPHVKVVDLTKTPIVEITPKGVRTSDREHAVDVIVFATGFDAMTGSQVAVDIVGKGAPPSRRSGPTAPEPPGPALGRLPEPLHRHRAAQPLGAQQRGGVHRTARGVDHRLHRPPAEHRQHRDRRHCARRGGLVRPRRRPRLPHPLPGRRLLVHGGQRAGQAAGVPRLHGRCGPVPGGVRRRRPGGVPRLRPVRQRFLREAVPAADECHSCPTN
ncbi:flavin-containing monooxygenase [Streptomyces stramineus]